MSIVRPLKWDTTLSGLKQMSDSELELLAYRLRKAWATDLYDTYTGAMARDGSATNGNGFGAVYRGSTSSATNTDHTYLTSFADRRKNAVHATKADNAHDNYADNDDTFSAPSEATFDATESDRQTFYYEEYNPPTDSSAYPSAPSPTVFNTHSYLKWDTSGYMKIEGTDANLIDTVIKLANYEMFNGDEVGTLRVASSSPGSDWTDLGLFMQDTVMTWSSYDTSGGGSSTRFDYKLWIRLTDSSVTESASNDNRYVLWNSSSNRIDQVANASTYSIIDNVLLPVWKRSADFDGTTGDFGFPRYEIVSVPNAGTHRKDRGVVTDTVYSDGAVSHGDTNSAAGPFSGTYYKARYGSSGFTETGSRYLIAYLPSAATRT